MTPTSKPFRLGVLRPLRRGWIGFLTLLALSTVDADAQTKPKGYLLPQEQGLEMLVHIVGEVVKPGEYRVPDNTDVLELVAKAGGPTEYANLSTVRIRRVMPAQVSSTRNVTRLGPSLSIVEVDLKDAWKKRDQDPVPRLVPGDVVVVSKNSWFGYKRFATIMRDAAVVASAYFLYRRVVED